MMDIGKMIWLMDLELIIIAQEQFMKDNGKMIINMDKEKYEKFD